MVAAAAWRPEAEWPARRRPERSSEPFFSLVSYKDKKREAAAGRTGDATATHTPKSPGSKEAVFGRVRIAAPTMTYWA